jgi:hypothetical protein
MRVSKVGEHDNRATGWWKPTRLKLFLDGKVNDFPEPRINGFGKLIQTRIPIMRRKKMGRDHDLISLLSQGHHTGHPGYGFRCHFQHDLGFREVAKLQRVKIRKVEVIPLSDHATNFVMSGDSEITLRDGEFQFRHDVLIGFCSSFSAVIVLGGRRRATPEQQSENEEESGAEHEISAKLFRAWNGKHNERITLGGAC